MKVDTVRGFISKSLRVPHPEIVQDEVESLSAYKKLSLLKKQLHKWSILSLNRQLGLYTESAQLRPGARILLFYSGVNNLGDALMDLSGRALLSGTSYKLDVVLDPSLAELFRHDRYFSKVYTDYREIDFGEYDFVILNKLGIRVIKEKIRYAGQARFTSLIGWYAGRNFNHIQFSYYSFNKILNSGIEEAALYRSSRLILDAPQSQDFPAQMWAGRIAISVGGRESNRIYGKWADVLARLDDDPEMSRYQYVLIGSDNGLKEASDLTAMSFRNLKLDSLVGKLKIHECYALIGQSRLFVGADGGLLHIAHAAGVPTVALFSDDIDPRTRYVENDFFRCSPLIGPTDVTSIEPNDVVRVMKNALPR
ncbi:MAG TPA: glycosyltransferase family 9 protein [Paraburkholderia sp.]|uniref:glycosyltransferase family 9 protein n=1 Tax=Paraburkholderia sp. TaxID=1926495 RepID=UPI002B498ACC|nr:glycosyltransferase family 9 protein [Paraburkholderia sp.]HKR41358.1 glycosyltransferase family 9 protein [Paraburkholderia sp.]